MKCENCGSELMEDVKVCGSCGTFTTDTPVSQAPPSAPITPALMSAPVSQTPFSMPVKHAKKKSQVFAELIAGLVIVACVGTLAAFFLFGGNRNNTTGDIVSDTAQSDILNEAAAKEEAESQRSEIVPVSYQQDNGNDALDYIMVYEGEQIPMSDFIFALMASGSSGDDAEAVISDAMNLLIETLTVARHAKEAGIVLSEEEWADMLAFAAQFRAQYGAMGYNFSFITDARIAEIMSTDTYNARLMEANTADYTVDEEDFAVSLKDYKENQKAAYYDIRLKYIATETKAEAEAALDALTAGNFDRTAEAFMKQPPAGGAAETEETEFRVPVTTINAMNNSGMFPAEALRQILELKAGGRTGVIAGTGAYYIFEVTRVNIPTDEELEVSYREEYTTLKKNEIFRGILDKWIVEASYKFNRQAVDTLMQ